ncbi:MAG TPA: hypothetical protein VM580_22105, partial [Labilithrix sp.]|nr:hypothetical protein [Labilithrix sp.]
MTDELRSGIVVSNKRASLSRGFIVVAFATAPWLLHCSAEVEEATAEDESALGKPVGDEICTAPKTGPSAELADYFENNGGRRAYGDVASDALTTFIRAEALYFRCEYAKAKELLAALWKRHPPGDNDWHRATASVAQTNLGSPTAYYALRMLTDAVNYRLAPAKNVKATDIVMTVVLVGCSEGIQPRSFKELNNGTGVKVKNRLDSRLAGDRIDPILNSSVRLFREYITAMTDGRLKLQTRVHRLSNVCVPVDASAKPYRRAAMSDESPIWAGLPQKVKDTTDFWWTLYPS